MSYQQYQTSAFILESNASGEHSRRLTLLTRELGLVSALAQGLRKENSKLRFSLQPLSYASVVLVRGRETWRVTGAIQSEHIWLRLRESQDVLALIARLSALCRRMLHGEEENTQLFDVLFGCISFLSEKISLTDSELLTVEAITAARILHLLGYVRSDKKFGTLFETSGIVPELIESITKERPSLLRTINASLQASHL